MFQFEGKCSLVWPDQTIRFMFHVDHAAGMLRLQVDDRAPYTHSFAEWAELLKGLIPAPRMLLSALTGAQPEQEPERIALLASVAGIGPGLHRNPNLRNDAEGVTSIRSSKSCQKADFGPQGSTVVDLNHVDFSGVRFVDTDFSKAILLGVNFTGCSFERCTFERNQLFGKKLNKADLTKQDLQNLNLTGAVLDEAKLDGLDIAQCDLTDASLKNASVNLTRFRSSNLTLARLDGMTGKFPLFLDCNLAMASIRNVVLANAVFSGSQLASTKAEGASLIDARFGHLTVEDLIEHIRPRAHAGVHAGSNPIDNPAALNLVNFSGATLTRARFDRARLTEVNFEGAKMDGAIFGGASFWWVSFKDADLTGADFGNREAEYFQGQKIREPAAAAIFDGVDLDNANLQSSSFRTAKLTGKVKHTRTPRRDTTKGKRMCLAGAEFNSSLLGLDWSHIDASGAKITLHLAGTAEIKGFKARQAILPVVDFAGLKLPEADFVEADLRKMHFGNCELRGAKFGKAILEAADFTGADLQDANFEYASLMNANFSSTWMWGAAFNGAVLTEANFSSAMLAEVDFKGISDGRLSHVNFSGACLVSATFSNIKAPSSGDKRTNFSSACLAGADFVGASLMDVALTSARLAANSGSIRVVHGLRPAGQVFEYDSTKLDPRSTGPNTTCPDGKGGTCSTAQLHTFSVPKQWPFVPG